MRIGHLSGIVVLLVASTECFRVDTAHGQEAVYHRGATFEIRMAPWSQNLSPRLGQESTTFHAFALRFGVQGLDRGRWLDLGLEAIGWGSDAQNTNVDVHVSLLVPLVRDERWRTYFAFGTGLAFAKRDTIIGDDDGEERGFGTSLGLGGDWAPSRRYGFRFSIRADIVFQGLSNGHNAYFLPTIGVVIQ